MQKALVAGLSFLAKCFNDRPLPQPRPGFEPVANLRKPVSIIPILAACFYTNNLNQSTWILSRFRS